MAFANLQLAEPLVDAMVQLLDADLNTNIAALNETITDGYTVPPVALFLPFVPAIGTLQGGLPAIGVQELPSEFVDDLQFAVDAITEYMVVAIVENVDPQTLAIQLRRLMQAIAVTVQADREEGTSGGNGGVMRAAGALSVNFMRTEPGPMLGQLDPNNVEAPPIAYLSWTGLVLSSRTRQVG